MIIKYNDHETGRVVDIDLNHIDGLIAEADANRDRYLRAASYGNPNAQSYGSMWARRATAYRKLKAESA